MMDKLLQVLLTANLDKKPTVDELAKLAGVEKVTGAERDEAWDKFTAAKKAEEDKAIAEAQRKADADAAAAKAQSDKDAANAPKTTQAKEDKPAYKVTVKRDGFRRLGRAWVGNTELKASELSAADLKILNADPMFVVVEL
jgi:phenylalanyl-tRNA synthetase alpha subunit